MANCGTKETAGVVLRNKKTGEVKSQGNVIVTGLGNKNDILINQDNHLYEKLSEYVGKTLTIEGTSDGKLVSNQFYEVVKSGDTLILSEIK